MSSVLLERWALPGSAPFKISCVRGSVEASVSVEAEKAWQRSFSGWRNEQCTSCGPRLEAACNGRAWSIQPVRSSTYCVTRSVPLGGLACIAHVGLSNCPHAPRTCCSQQQSHPASLHRALSRNLYTSLALQSVDVARHTIINRGDSD